MPVSKDNMRILFLFILMTLFLFACPQNEPPERVVYRSYDWPVGNPEDHGINPTRLSDGVSEAGKYGFIESLLIVRNDVLVSETYFYLFSGENDPWIIRSATKGITSALIGIAIAEHYIDSVDQRIVDFFPEYVNQSMDPRKTEITIKHLLTMKSGYPSDENIDSLEINASNLMRSIFQLELTGNPGESFGYSSLGAHLLSGIIKKATRMSPRDFAQQVLFDPLQIPLYYWDNDPQGIPLGGTGLYMSSRDMARFGYLYLKNGLVDERQIVPEEWIQQSIQDHVGLGLTWGALQDFGYGYLWWLGRMGKYRIYFALGWAGQFILILPDLAMVIVTTCDFPLSSEEADYQERSILSLIADHIIPAVNP